MTRCTVASSEKTRTPFGALGRRGRVQWAPPTMSGWKPCWIHAPRGDRRCEATASCAQDGRDVSHSFSIRDSLLPSPGPRCPRIVYRFRFEALRLTRYVTYVSEGRLASGPQAQRGQTPWRRGFFYASRPSVPEGAFLSLSIHKPDCSRARSCCA